MDEAIVLQVEGYLQALRDTQRSTKALVVVSLAGWGVALLLVAFLIVRKRGQA